MASRLTAVAMGAAGYLVLSGPLRVVLAIFIGVVAYKIAGSPKWKLVLLTTAVTGYVTWWLMGYVTTGWVRIIPALVTMGLVVAMADVKEIMLYVDNNGDIWTR